MRPRHCCRGRHDRTFPPSYEQARRFNEAAALLPRKAGCLHGYWNDLFTRFNEAAALLPRKASQEAFGRMSMSMRFNEAAALLPRKAMPHPDEISNDPLASMRPRHCCRGRPVIALTDAYWGV